MPVAADGQLVGEFATRVQERIRDDLSASRPGYEWTTEHAVASTPVDVVGRDDGRVVLVELEWRRADPADNAAKLFRHLSTGSLAADRAAVCQVFTRYYDLADGGVSAKRANAEFVGSVAADAVPELAYHPVDLPLDPPKRGGDPPDGWRDAVGDAAETVAGRVP